AARRGRRRLRRHGLRRHVDRRMRVVRQVQRTLVAAAGKQGGGEAERQQQQRTAHDRTPEGNGREGARGDRGRRERPQYSERIRAAYHAHAPVPENPMNPIELLRLPATVLAVLLGTGGWALRGYRLLGEETPVVDIDAHILSPQRWAVTLTWPDGSTRRLELAGDDWRVEAVVLKWKLPAVLAGLPPLYRLARIDGRYDDPAQEASAPRTV